MNGDKPLVVDMAALNFQEDSAPERPSEVTSARLSHPAHNSPEFQEMAAERGTAPPPSVSFRSILVQFVKTIVASGSVSDLHTITCPAIILNGISLLEYGIHWAEYPELLTAMSAASAPKERMVAVLRWFVSNLPGMYASRSKSSGFERKPYNPILGEQFFAWWPKQDIELCAEQVSHHPPVTGFYLKSDRAGVYINGYSGQKTGFTGTALRAEQTGRFFIYLPAHQEEYMISLPELHVRGILTGSTFIELTGETVIVCTSGFGAKLKFLPKPWFSGEYDRVEGIVAELGKSPTQHYTLRGRWSDKVLIKDLSSQRESTLYSIAEIKRDALPEVTPLAEQGPMESRRVWQPVTAALSKADYPAATAAKTAIEDTQRSLRKSRPESAWQPQFFRKADFCFMPTVAAPPMQVRFGSTSDLTSMTTEYSDSLTRSSSSSSSSSSLSFTSSTSSWQESLSLSSSKKSQGKLVETQRWVHADFLRQFVDGC